MIGKKELSMYKKGIHCKCGKRRTSKRKDLYDALVSGQVAAAAIDVFDTEPNYDKNQKNKIMKITAHPGQCGSNTAPWSINSGSKSQCWNNGVDPYADALSERNGIS